MYKQAELSREDHQRLFKYAKDIGITIFSTPFDEESVDFLDSLGVPLFKVASGDLTHHALLKHIAVKKKPMIISTGMATLSEVKEAVRIVETAGNKQIILLHCTSCYPCKAKDVNLKSVQTLMRTFPYPVGLSDHTLDETAAIALAAMGGGILEKHFTFNKNTRGIDHWLSMDAQEMQQLIAKVRTVETMLGSEKKAPTKAEKITLKLARRSVISTQDIPRGSTITPAMVSIRRPATGIQPKYTAKVVGKIAKYTIKAETPIIWKMLK
jgi:N-acetylneuraminate synthase/N,N'-diacetyllegionaminate synthase